MKRWVSIILAVALCLCLAVPAMAAGENVWSKYNMQLYGRVKMDYTYDTARFNNYNDFVGVVADSLGNPDWNNDSTNFNPRDTRFGFSATHEAGDWVGKGRLEIDFYGTNAGNNLIPRMRLGYIDLANKSMGTSVRAGQDWIPVSQLHPSTIDFGILSAAGNLWWRVPQFTVRQKLGDFEILGSAMLHRRTDTGSETRMPWILGRLAYPFEAFDGKHMLAFGGGFQKDTDQSTKDDIDRWVAAGEFKFIFGPLLLKGEAWTGQGIGAHFLRYQLDAVDDPNDPTKTRALNAWGGWVDLTYKIMPRWSVTVGAGIDDPDDDDWKFTQGGTTTIIDQNDRQFNQNTQTYVNTWWSLTDAIKAGFEWIYLSTERVTPTGTDQGKTYTDSGNRFTLSMFYNF